MDTLTKFALLFSKTHTAIPMDIDTLRHTITATFKDSYCTEANGDFFFFYGPDQKFPFVTLVTKDDNYDQVSQLNREGIFRLNIGVGKASFQSLFGHLPSKPGIGGYMDCGLDFTQLNTLLPHPTYGSMYWICVLNPNEETLRQLAPYLEEAYAIAVKRSGGSTGREQ